jgi:hypothetical protein
MHWLEYQDWGAAILERPLEVRNGFAFPPTEAGLESSRASKAEMLREKRLLRGEITAIQGNVVDSGRGPKVCSQDADVAPRDNRPINRRRRRGIIPQNAAGLVNTIQTHLASFGPATEGQKTLHAEAYRVTHYHP